MRQALPKRLNESFFPGPTPKKGMRDFFRRQVLQLLALMIGKETLSDFQMFEIQPHFLNVYAQARLPGQADDCHAVTVRNIELDRISKFAFELGLAVSRVGKSQFRGCNAKEAP